MRVPLLAALLEAAAARRRCSRSPRHPASRRACAPPSAATCPTRRCSRLPAWETLPHERLSPSAETSARGSRRCAPSTRWQKRRPASGRSPDRGGERAGGAPAARAPDSPRSSPIVLTASGAATTWRASASGSSSCAYVRVDLVTRRGEFAVRGGILDVFAPDAEHPVRAEFFGDELEQLRALLGGRPALAAGEVDARRAGAEPRAAAHRCRAAARPRDASRVPDAWRRCSRRSPRASRSRAWSRWRPRCSTSSCRSPTTCPTDAAIAILGPERVSTRAVNLAETNREFLDAAWNAATAGAQAPIDLGAGDFLTVTGAARAAGDRAWWTLSPFDAERRRRRSASTRSPCRASPVRSRARSTTSPLLAQGLDRRRRRDRPRPGRARRRRAGRARGRGSAGRGFPTTRAGVAYLVKGSVEAGFELPEAQARAAQRGRVLRSHRRRRLPPGEAARQPPQERRRPAAAASRATSSCTRPTASAGSSSSCSARSPAASAPRAARSAPRSPPTKVLREYLVHRVRAEQARLPGRQALRAHRPARPAHPLRRRREPGAEQDGRIRLGGRQGQGAQGGARHRRRAGQALQRAHGQRRARLPARHPVAARAGGGVPVRRDARPAGDHRRGQGRHGAADPDGPPDLGRRRLRQDRDRGACGVQGGAGRQAGRDAGADDAAGPPAHGDLQRALRRLPGAPARAQPLPDRQGVEGDDRGSRARRGGCRDRHPPAAERRHPVQGSRPA